MLDWVERIILKIHVELILNNNRLKRIIYQVVTCVNKLSSFQRSQNNFRTYNVQYFRFERN